MFLHLFYTWLLSNFLHPVLFMALSVIRTDIPNIPDAEVFTIGFILFIASLLLSLPCLLLGWLCLYLINASPNSVGIKFILWLATAPSLVFLEFLLILFAYDEMSIELFLFSIPAIAAVVIAIVVRYGQFDKLNYTLAKKQL